MNLNSFVTKKTYTSIFLICIMAIIPSVLSGIQGANVWERLLNVIESPLSNVIFFLSLIILISSIIKNVCYNHFFLSRYSTYEELVKNGLAAIIISTIILYCSFFIIAIASSFLFSFGNYQISLYENYHINILFYLIFKLIKNSCIYTIASSFIFLIFIYLKNDIIKFLIIILNVIFFFIKPSFIIDRIFKIPSLFQNYLISLNYLSFYLEFVVFIVYILILLIILRLLYKLIIKRKRLM